MMTLHVGYSSQAPGSSVVSIVSLWEIHEAFNAVLQTLCTVRLWTHLSVLAI